MKRLAVAAALCVVLAGCAMFRAAARTALDVAREACDVFLSERAESSGDDAVYGMSLDQCAEILLSAQQAQIAAAKKE